MPCKQGSDQMQIDDFLFLISTTQNLLLLAPERTVVELLLPFKEQETALEVFNFF